MHGEKKRKKVEGKNLIQEEWRNYMKGEYVGRWKEERSRKDRGIAGKDKKKEGGRNERIRKDEGNA